MEFENQLLTSITLINHLSDKKNSQTHKIRVLEPTKNLSSNLIVIISENTSQETNVEVGQIRVNSLNSSNLHSFSKKFIDHSYE